MARSKYGHLITRESFAASIHSEITAPKLNYIDKTGKKDLSFGWNCTDKPLVFIEDSHTHEFDEFLCIMGSNPYDMKEFETEVEICFGEERQKHVFTEPGVVYIPRGLVHCPLQYTRVGKPTVMLNVALSPGYSQEKAVTDYGKLITKAAIQKRLFEAKYYIDKKLIREEKRESEDMVYTGKDAGGGALQVYWYAITEPFVMYEPPHAHDHDQFAVFLGGNAMDIREFDGEIDMWLGEEAEKHTINGTSVVHIPKGLVHRRIDFRRIDKPITMINLFAAAEYKKARTLKE
jgi:hypothetical protein